MSPRNGNDCGTPELPSELSSGSVVFSLPHLRDAVFTFHRQALFAQRDTILAQIPRPMPNQLWTSLGSSNWYYRVGSYYSRNAAILKRDTKYFELLERLGLSSASWLDFVLSRTLDAAAWLIGFSHHRKSPSLKLEAYPQSRLNSGNAHESSSSNPMEMLVYEINRFGFQRNGGLPHGVTAPYFDHLVQDQHGRTYVARLVEPMSQPFLFEAAQRCPKLLYSEGSPLFPVHDVLFYSQQPAAAAVYIWQTPPWPLSRSLLVGEAASSWQWQKDELRRIIERARDLFANLATLEAYGVSLGKERWSKQWHKSLVIKDSAPCLVPAYLTRSPQVKAEGRLSRMGHWVEQLPEPPQRPWPLTTLKTRTLSSSLPSSQTSAYHDPRVHGPTTYFHNVDKATWTDTAAVERETWHGYGLHPHLGLTPRGRFNADLLVVTHFILRDLLFDHQVDNDTCVKMLNSGYLSAAYQTWLEAPTDCLPRPATGAFGRHSTLFTACPTCAQGGHASTLPSDGPAAGFFNGKCPRGHYGDFVSAIPAKMEQLLLRIARPTSRADGSTDIVTAREAAEIMDDVLKTETPHLEALYNRWADAQVDDAPRLTSPADVRLPLILGDSSVHRWLMLELLRGNYLDEDLGRDELNKMRDTIRDELTPLQQRKRDEFRAACGDVAAADDGSEEAGDRKEKEEVARPTRAARSAAASSSAVGEAGEAESSSSGAKKGGKRGAGDSSKPAAAKKKSKKSK